jgi:hypothetical protein
MMSSTAGNGSSRAKRAKHETHDEARGPVPGAAVNMYRFTGNVSHELDGTAENARLTA